MRKLTIYRAHEGDNEIRGEWILAADQDFTLIVNGQQPDKINHFRAAFHCGYAYEDDRYDIDLSVRLPFELARGDIVQIFMHAHDGIVPICTLNTHDRKILHKVRGEWIY